MLIGLIVIEKQGGVNLTVLNAFTDHKAVDVTKFSFGDCDNSKLSATKTI